LQTLCEFFVRRERADGSVVAGVLLHKRGIRETKHAGKRGGFGALVEHNAGAVATVVVPTKHPTSPNPWGHRIVVYGQHRVACAAVPNSSGVETDAWSHIRCLNCPRLASRHTVSPWLSSRRLRDPVRTQRRTLGAGSGLPYSTPPAARRRAASI